MQKVIRDVRVELTEAERNKLGDEIAASVMRCEAIETQKRIVTADLTSSQKNERKGYREKSKALREGFVWKAIDCEERPDFARNMVEVYRLDTQEKLDERAMRSEERQAAIDFPAPDGEVAPVVPIGSKKKRMKPDDAEAPKDGH